MVVSTFILVLKKPHVSNGCTQHVYPLRSPRSVSSAACSAWQRRKTHFIFFYFKKRKTNKKNNERGTVASRLLVELGLSSPEAALRRIREVRPGAVETWDQERSEKEPSWTHPQPPTSLPHGFPLLLFFFLLVFCSCFLLLCFVVVLWSPGLSLKTNGEKTA